MSNLLDQLTPAEVNAFWAGVDERTDRRIAVAIEQFAANYRPRGKGDLDIVLGTPGLPLVANVDEPAAHCKVSAPFDIDLCHITIGPSPAPIGSVQFDLVVQRCVNGVLQPVSSAGSIVSGSYPALVFVRENLIVPSEQSWGSWHIEGGSMLWVYVRLASGVNCVGLCLSGRWV